MLVTVDVVGEQVLIQYRGDLDCAAVNHLMPKLDDWLMDEYSQYVLDLRWVPFMDSSGASLIVEFYRMLKARGDAQLYLLQPTQQARRLLEVLHIHRVVKIVDDPSALGLRVDRPG